MLNAAPPLSTVTSLTLGEWAGRSSRGGGGGGEQWVVAVAVVVVVVSGGGSSGWRWCRVGGSSRAYWMYPASVGVHYHPKARVHRAVREGTIGGAKAGWKVGEPVNS